jgi:hypothetical protein
VLKWRFYIWQNGMWVRDLDYTLLSPDPPPAEEVMQVEVVMGSVW